MTRIECETKIAEHLEAIANIYHEYHPGGNTLSMFYIRKKDYESVSCFNEHWGKDFCHPVDITKRNEFPSIPNPFRNINCQKDNATGLYNISVDGVMKYEHLAEDEVDEVLKQLLRE